MRKNKQPFYKEFMIKRRPKTPKCICNGKINRALGIISPSLRMIVAAGGKGTDAAEQLEIFERQTARYLCYKRQLNKDKWKMLYRQHREERRKHEKF